MTHVSYTGNYENETACKNFIVNILDYFFQEDIKKKMKLVNFIAVLFDRRIYRQEHHRTGGNLCNLCRSRSKSSIYEVFSGSAWLERSYYLCFFKACLVII